MAKKLKRQRMSADLQTAVKILFDLYVAYGSTDVLSVADKEAINNLLGKPRIKASIKRWLETETFYALKGTDVNETKKAILDCYKHLGERIW